MKHLLSIICLSLFIGLSVSRSETVAENAKEIAEQFKGNPAEPWKQIEAALAKSGVSDTKLVAAYFQAAAEVWPDQIVELVRQASTIHPLLAPLVTATVTGVRRDLLKEVIGAAAEGLAKSDPKLTFVQNPDTKKPEDISSSVRDAISIAGMAGEKYGPVDDWLWKIAKEDPVFAELSRQILTPAARISYSEAASPA